MKYGFGLVCAVFLVVSSLEAQPAKYKLSAQLRSSSDSSALVNALVELREGDKLLSSALTGDRGYFEASSPRGANTLVVKYMGANYNLEIAPLEANRDLGIIYIDIPSHKLAELEVVAQRPLVRYDGGKAIYNLSQIKGVVGADVLEALGRIPSLQFRSGQGFLLNGFESLVVLIDKRPIRMSASEVESYLASLPVSDIASVELIANPSLDYASAGQPVLNIVTKRYLEDGYNAFLSLRGTYQYYLSEYLNARLNLNKGISRSYISYGFSDARSRETTELVGISRTEADVLPRRTHQLSLGTLLQLGKVHSLDAHLYGTLQSECFYRQANEGNRLNRPRLHGAVQHRYQSKALELHTLLEGATASLNQEVIGLGSRQIKEYSDFFRLTPTLYYKLGRGLNLRAGVAYEHSFYRNEYLSQGTDYRYREHQTNTFVGLSYTKRALSMDASLGANFYTALARGSGLERSLSDFALLPRMTLLYRLAPKHLLTAELRSSYLRPSYRDLTPISTMSTDTWLREGNASLRPSRAYTAALRYTFMQAAQLELSYSRTSYPMVEQLLVARGGQISLRKVNLDDSRYWRGLIVLPLPLASSKGFSWLATTTAAIQRQEDRGSLQGNSYNQAFTTYYLNHRHDLNFGSGWSIGAGLTYYGSLYYGLYKMSPTWWLEASLAKRIGDWRIVASLRDPWNTNTAKGSYSGLSQTITFIRDWHRPQLSLSLSYTLGKQTLKSYQARSRQDATERMRSEANEGIARGAGL